MAIKFGLPGIKQKPAPKQPAKLTFGDKLKAAIAKKPMAKGFSPGLVKKLKRANTGAAIGKSIKPAALKAKKAQGMSAGRAKAVPRRSPTKNPTRSQLYPKG